MAPHDPARDAAPPAASMAPAPPPPPLGWRTISHLAIASARAWSDDRCASMGAALAYYTLFSLAPLLLIVVSVAGLWFGPEAARGEVVVQLRGLFGEAGAAAVQQLLASVDRPAGNWLAMVVGSVLMLVGATTVFAELQASLDHIWRTPAPPTQAGIGALLRTRLLSFGVILALGFLLIVSLLLSAGVSALQQGWAPDRAVWRPVLLVVDTVLNFGLVTLLFAFIYKVMPRVRLAWTDVWVGAVVTALLFGLGRTLIGLYLQRNAFASGFGAAGALVVVLVWVYYSAQVFLFGAECSRVIAQHIGSRRDARAARRHDADLLAAR
ncbi:MAG: YihY/virulence factor BrkB family protein [Rubrivivax sp.]